MGKADGIYPRMDGRRGRLLGNAVVSAIAEWIGIKITEMCQPDPDPNRLEPSTTESWMATKGSR